MLYENEFDNRLIQEIFAKPELTAQILQNEYVFAVGSTVSVMTGKEYRGIEIRCSDRMTQGGYTLIQKKHYQMFTNMDNKDN